MRSVSSASSSPASGAAEPVGGSGLMATASVRSAAEESWSSAALNRSRCVSSHGTGRGAPTMTRVQLLEQHVGRALDDQQPAAGLPVLDQDAHPLAPGAERGRGRRGRYCAADMTRPCRRGRCAAATRAGLRRVRAPATPGPSSLAQRGVAGQRSAADRPARPRGPGHRPGVPAARRPGWGPVRSSASPVPSRSTSPDAVTTRRTVIDAKVRVPGLVGADHRRRAQRLHRGQPGHDRVAPRHPLHPEAQHHREHRRQPLRHRCHRERHPEQQHGNGVGRGAKGRGERRPSPRPRRR